MAAWLLHENHQHAFSTIGDRNVTSMLDNRLYPVFRSVFTEYYDDTQENYKHLERK